MDSNANERANSARQGDGRLPWQLVFLLIVIVAGVLGLIARAVGLI